MPLDPSLIQSRLDCSPFLGWLGLRAEAVQPPTVRMRLPWKDLFVATPELGGLNGGIIATVLDCAASYAVIAQAATVWVTVDLRVDYHGRAEVGDLLATGESVRIGRSIATSDARLFDRTGRLVASARATFMNRGISISEGEQS